MIHALPVKKMPQIRHIHKQKDAVWINPAPVKQLDVFYRVIKLRMHAPGIPELFIFAPQVFPVPCRYKIDHF
jgi:hypothetical protein